VIKNKDEGLTANLIIFPLAGKNSVVCYPPPSLRSDICSHPPPVGRASSEERSEEQNTAEIEGGAKNAVAKRIICVTETIHASGAEVERKNANNDSF